MPETVVSIVVLTRNGAREIRQCLAGIYSQENPPPFEVVVIDSGSSDRTLEIAKTFPVEVTEIAQHEFGHGRTRNLGASLARGKYLVYLTQDAIPANGRWLSSLTNTLEQDSRVAGAYSRWLPKAKCSPIDARLIRDMFGPTKETRSLEGLEETDVLAHMPHMMRFSNVSSCLRRTVWQSIRFDSSLQYAEDQQWARAVLESGHTIVYEPRSVVYHSHSDPLKLRFKREFDAGIAFARIIDARYSLLNMVPSCLIETAADWAFMAQTRSRRRILWAVFSLLVHATNYAGWWAGSHERHIPVWAKKRISMAPQAFG